MNYALILTSEISCDTTTEHYDTLEEAEREGWSAVTQPSISSSEPAWDDFEVWTSEDNDLIRIVACKP